MAALKKAEEDEPERAAESEEESVSEIELCADMACENGEEEEEKPAKPEKKSKKKKYMFFSILLALKSMEWETKT